MMLTLTLAAGLLAAPEPQAEPPKGKGWIIEVRGFIKHRKQAEPPKGLIIEFQARRAEMIAVLITEQRLCFDR